MENLFRNLDILESWYNLNIIDLDEYLRIKSNIVDVYRNEPKEDNKLPF